MTLPSGPVVILTRDMIFFESDDVSDLKTVSAVKGQAFTLGEEDEDSHGDRFAWLQGSTGKRCIIYVPRNYGAGPRGVNAISCLRPATPLELLAKQVED